MSKGQYRNYKCYCKSGKKYKNCHLVSDEKIETEKGVRLRLIPQEGVVRKGL